MIKKFNFYLIVKFIKKYIKYFFNQIHTLKLLIEETTPSNINR